MHTPVILFSMQTRNNGLGYLWSERLERLVNPVHQTEKKTESVQNEKRNLSNSRLEKRIASSKEKKFDAADIATLSTLSKPNALWYKSHDTIRTSFAIIGSDALKTSVTSRKQGQPNLRYFINSAAFSL